MVAREVNRLGGLHGRALGDRAHVRALATPFEAWRALRYVVRQGVHHGYALHPWVDPYCSFGAVVQRSWAYLTRGRSWVWRKLGIWNDELWRIAHLVLASPREA